MLYPRYFSAQGYSEALLKEYIEKYTNFLTKEEIRLTIGYIVSQVNFIIEQNKDERFILAIQWLSNINQVTKEECLEISKKIGPINAMSALFSAVQEQPIGIAKLIQNNMGFHVKEESEEKYLDFLNKMSIRCIKELALINDPNAKKRSCKKVIFNENFALGTTVREYVPMKELTNYKELSETEKSQWLNRSKQDFKAYLKRERRRDLQALSENAEVDTETAESTAKKFRVNIS